MINRILSILDQKNRSSEEIKFLVDYYKSNPFFESIAPQNNEEVLYNLFENVYIETYQQGDIIFKEGDSSNQKMYVIVKGIVVVVINRLGLKLVDKQREVKKYFTENQVQQIQSHTQIILNQIGEYGKIQAVLHDGSYFGEKAIQEPKGKRVSTIFVLDQTHLLVIERKVYLQFKEAIQQHWLKMQSIISICVPYFDQIDQKKIQDQLIYSFGYKEYNKGEYIIKQGQEKYENLLLSFLFNDFIFILTEGECEISKNIQFSIKARNYKKNVISKPSQVQNNKLFQINKPNHNKVEKDFQISISQGSALDIFGCEKLFEQFSLQTIIKKIKNTLNEDKKLDQIGFHNLIRQQQSSLNQPYLYSVKVISLTAKCIYISKEDFIQKFPEQCVQGVQINFIQKLFQRYIKIENSYDNVKPTLEEKDKFSWLQPEIAKLSKTNEKTYIQRLYQSYLLGDVAQYCNLQKIKNPQNQSSISNEKFPPLNQDSTKQFIKQTLYEIYRYFQHSSSDNTRIKNNSSIQNKFEQSKQTSVLIQEEEQPQYEIYQLKREKIQKQYRLPETVEFQNMNIKNLELAIKSELISRGLIKLPKSKIYSNIGLGKMRNKSERIRNKIIQSSKSMFLNLCNSQQSSTDSSFADSTQNNISENQFLDNSSTKVRAKGSQYEYFGSKQDEIDIIGTSENNVGFFKMTQFQHKFKQTEKL